MEIVRRPAEVTVTTEVTTNRNQFYDVIQYVQL